MNRLTKLVGETKAIFASVLCLPTKALAAAGLLALVLLAPSAWAAEVTNVKYIDAAGKEQTCAAATVVAASDTRVTWTPGWYVVNGEVTVKGGADCSGAVHLILADTGKLTINNVADGYAGIGVSGSDNSFAVYGQTLGTGALTVTGGSTGAGIGGGNNKPGSNITINGGTVTANGGCDSAGIGGGYDGAGSNITINVGTVVATGNNGGAGIGGGSYCTGSNIKINGGEVTANGGNYGAGIGNGYYEAGPHAENIFAADDVIVKVGASANPTDEIEHTGAQDIASDLAGKRYVTTVAPVKVTVVVPEVAGASAELFTFDVDGGWTKVASDKVPSNATVRVVWTAAADKGLTGAGAASAFQWQAELVADKAVQTVPAPTVGAAGESEVTIVIDTRADKTYIKADDILPVWYAAGAMGAEVKAKGEGEQSWETLVKCSATTNTLSWKPTEQGVYTLSHIGFENATIKLVLPVEVTTNDLAVAGATAQVTVDGSPLVAQTEGEFAGKLIVPTNSTVTVMWTVTGAGKFFPDGSMTYVQTFAADKSVNPAGEAVVMPAAPAAPSVKLGVVAQRYPWDGKLDVEYWAKNTPSQSYDYWQIKVTVTLPDGTTASESQKALNGKNTTVFDAKKAFGEVKFAKGVKVKAEIVNAPPPM